MLRLVSDEDFDGRITKGLRRKQPDLDLVRVQDVALRERPDERILEWAAFEDRVLLTHDRTTIPGHVKQRLAADLPVTGAIIVSQWMKIGHAIDEIRLVVACSHPDEWTDRILFVPL